MSLSDMSKRKLPQPQLLKKLSAVRLVVFDFDGVFTDNKVIVTQKGEEAVVCSRADGYGLAMLRSAEVDSLVLSSEVNLVVSARCRKLKLCCIQGCADKLRALKKLASERGLTLAQIAYVGNDINDLACMGAVGLPVAVADAYPQALEVAAYITSRKGGEGAVREICEMLSAAKRRN